MPCFKGESNWKKPPCDNPVPVKFSGPQAPAMKTGLVQFIRFAGAGSAATETLACTTGILLLADSAWPD